MEKTVYIFVREFGPKVMAITETPQKALIMDNFITTGFVACITRNLPNDPSVTEILINQRNNN